MDGRWKGDPSKDWTGYRWLGQANLFGSDAFCRELNNSTKIAVATETRFRDEGDVYHISMAWSSDNWASAPLTGDEVGPSGP